ncbi:RsiV family protein [Suttonella sp. R2A3]|uniref:RsiV family protein n=1 Tax=Suttonella sp. R2A3 TaxID=2908648 RepID=UPI001F172529|nr:RsiV family protein [Suttonella sp. R2A3]UJF23897.1 RsiV family protein [Suttonella sp. R2A3]
MAFSLSFVLFTLMGIFIAPPVFAHHDTPEPSPPANMVVERTLNKQYCASARSQAEQDCSAVTLEYPEGLDAWLNTWLVDSLRAQLTGIDNQSGSLEDAMDAYVREQTALGVAQNGIGELNIRWQRIGRQGGLQVLVEQGYKIAIKAANGENWRELAVFDHATQTRLMLEDVLVSGQGEQLYQLQADALSAWLQKHDYNANQAAEMIAAMEVKGTDNWAPSQDGLVFSYPQYAVGPRTLGMPVIFIAADKLEGVIRPDVLTAARSWPVDVQKQLMR